MSPNAGSGRRRSTVQRETVTLTLRFHDGQTEARVVSSLFGGATAYKPLLLGSVANVRARRLLDALLLELQPGNGSDALFDQMSLFDRRGEL